MKTTLLRCCALVLGAAIAHAQPPLTEELPIGFLPMEWVNGAVRKVLSADARATLVTPTGPLRITGGAGDVRLVRDTLRDLQRAPALVPIELSFTTYARRTMQRLPPEQPVAERAIPVPDRYDPPRILAGPGGVTVIPAQPRAFTTRRVGPGATVNLNPTGYTTGEAEVRFSETENVVRAGRRLNISGLLGKPSTVPVLGRVPDPAALRAVAVEKGAVPANEPAWIMAATELLVTPELSGGSLVVNIVPQIVLPPAAAGQPARRVPLPACAAAVLVPRGAPPSTGLLPKTDPAFYRAFFALAPATDDTFTTLTVKGEVQYLGQPPP